MKFYPIINSSSDLPALAADYIKQLSVSDLDLEALELSFACPDLLEHLEKIYQEASSHKIKIGLASLIDLKQLKALKKIAKPWLDTRIEVFAPALDLNIYKTIAKDPWMSEWLDYIPGVYNEADVNALLRAGYTGTKFKIYPLAPRDSDDFFRSMTGPYPDLRGDNEVLTSQAKLAPQDDSVVIKSPRDYQRVCGKQNNYKFEPELRDPQSIIDYIKILVPRAKVIISGLGGNLQQIKSLTGYDFVATRMSVNEFNQYRSLSA